MPLSVIEREPPVGPSMRERVRRGRHVGRVIFDRAQTFQRCPFFVNDGPSGWHCEQEKFMLSPEARAYQSVPIEAYAFPNTDLLNSEGVIFLDGSALKDTVDYVNPAPANASTEWARPYEYLKLRTPISIDRVVEGQTLIGYAAAWRNYGHWLLQCVPKLVAFLGLRQQIPDLKVALPPLANDSAFQQSLDLLGIVPDHVLTVPIQAATRFSMGYVIENPSIWSISPLA